MVFDCCCFRECFSSQFTRFECENHATNIDKERERTEKEEARKGEAIRERQRHTENMKYETKRCLVHKNHCKLQINYSLWIFFGLIEHNFP